jgi:drug/metabolite transporter (DMT)-like permease
LQSRRALLLIAASALSFALMAFAAKLVSRDLPGGEVAFIRFLFMLAPFAVAPRLVRKALTWQRLDLLLYRGLFGGTAVLLYFLAIAHIPVGVATLLNYSSPIWSVLFAAIFLGERVRGALLLPFALAMAGMLLVTGAFADPAAPFRLGVWELAGFASSILSGAAVAAIRAARRTEGSWAIYGSFTLFGLVVTAPFALADFRWPTAAEWALLALVGAASIAAQLAMTYAYRWVTNLQAGALAQVTVVVTMALGVLFLGDTFGPSQLVGALLALAGIVGVVWLQSAPRAVE